MLELAHEADAHADEPSSARRLHLVPAPTAGARLLSLDVFRGLTIAAMVLVNNAGNWNYIYGPLRHAEWHGWTPTDFIFPFFVFIVGVAIPLAFEKRKAPGGSQRELYLKIFRRTAVIFGLGLLLNASPFVGAWLAHLRIPGVLQRIALCYCFAALIYLWTRTRGQAVTAAVLLLGYWALLKLVAAPGYARGDLSLEGSLASWVDRTVLAGHIYRPLYDPEGLLSTIPAIATALAGVLTGTWLQQKREPLDKAAGMFGAGALCVAVGWCWNLAFPINKPLWTSSYVVFTAGLALQLLALCYWSIDIKGVKRWATPFVVFGVNALALFVGSGFVADFMTVIHTTRRDGTPGDLKSFLYEHAFASWLTPVNASLAFALSYVALWWLVLWVLYRRRIFIKV